MMGGNRARFDEAVDATDSGTTPLLVELNEDLINRALAALWKFVTRPMRDGTRWSNGQYFLNSDELRKSLIGQPRLFRELSCEAIRVGQLPIADKEALQIAIGLIDAVHLSEHDEVATVFAHWGEGEGTSAMVNNRHLDREELFVSTYVKSDGLRHRVGLSNLSEGGAMIVGMYKSQGQRVEVRLPSGEWRTGVVRWSVENRLGVQFETAE